jgi:hypothetical protein
MTLRPMPMSKASRPSASAVNPSAAHSPRHAAVAIAVCALLLIIFYVLAWVGSWSKSPTFDEPLHFVSAWVQAHQDDFRCNPEDPPLWKYWVAAGTDDKDLKLFKQSPLWNQLLHTGSQFSFASLTLYESQADVTALFRDARARMAVLGVFLGVFIAWWAWRVAGPIAAVVATAAYSFDPNFLAHAPLVKNDVAMTLIFVAFMFAVWLIGENATVPRLFAVALLMGAALTTKFSGVLTIPLLLIALLIRALINSPWPMRKWVADTRSKRLVAAVVIAFRCGVIAWAFVWACYGFRFSPGRDRADLFDQKELIGGVARLETIKDHPSGATDAQIAQRMSEPSPSLPDRLFEWSCDHYLLPQAWLYGFYYTWGRSLIRSAFLCGNYSITGWWYYFPAAMIFKTPLATLIALALAKFFWLSNRKSPNASSIDAWSAIAFLILPVLYMLLAVTGDLNLGLRHAFPVYPFIFIFIGVMAARACRMRAKIARPVLAVLLVALCAETLSAYPDLIAFCNVAAGGSRGGLHLLSDSNLDWGQDLPALAAWQKQNPGRQIYLCYFGHADPRYYGIHYVNVAGSDAPDDEQPQPLPPVLAVSATNLQGIYLSPEQRDFYAKIQKQNPIAVLGGSIYIFDHVEDRLPPLRKSAAPGAAALASPAM